MVFPDALPWSEVDSPDQAPRFGSALQENLGFVDTYRKARVFRARPESVMEDPVKFPTSDDKPREPWTIAGVDWRNFALATATVAITIGALFIKWELSIYLVLVAMVFVPVERVLALNTQRIFRRGWWSDIAHVFSNGTFVAGVLIASLAGGHWVLSRLIPDAIPEAIAAQVNFLPDHLHWMGTGLLAIEAILISETFYYFAHRFAHENRFMWKFHALHHSIQEMDWLAAGRLHIVDQVFTRTVTVLPVVLLFPVDTLAKYIALTGFQAFFLHSNIKIDFGPLKYVFGTPEFHHWHHADEKQAWNKNYSEQFPFLDKVFGTLYMPQDRKPTKYGIGTLPPNDYLGQQYWSFKYMRKKKAKKAKKAAEKKLAEAQVPNPQQALAEAPGEGAGLPSAPDPKDVLKAASREAS